MTQLPDERAAEMRELFFETAQELLQSLNDEALKLEKSPADEELVRSIRRIVNALANPDILDARFTGQRLVQQSPTVHYLDRSVFKVARCQRFEGRIGRGDHNDVGLCQAALH